MPFALFFRTFATLASGYFANDAFEWIGKVTGTKEESPQGGSIVPLWIKLLTVGLIALVIVLIYRALGGKSK